MNRKIVFLIIILFTVKLVDAQIISSFQMNSTSFCGQNSILSLLDISTGMITSRTWTVNGPGGFTSFSGSNTTENVILTQLGAYSVRLESCDALGTCHDTLRSVFVNSLPIAVITVDDTVACYGTEVNFSSESSVFNTPGVQFSWDNDFNTGIDVITPSFTFLANADIVVMLMIEDDNGCIDSAFQNLFIVQNEEATFTLGNQCVGIPFELTTPSTASNSALDSIYWIVDSTLFLNGETQTYTHPIEDSIAIILYVVNDYGCSDGMLRFIKIENIPVLSTNITDTVICEGEELLLFVEGAYVYDWSTGESQDSIRVSPVEKTDYTVYGTSQSAGCLSEEIEIEVAVIQKPIVTFDSRNFNPTVGTPSIIRIDYDPKFAINDSLYWSEHGTTNELLNNSGFENSFVANETVSFPVELVYHKDGFTCTTKDSVKFEIDDNCINDNVYIANTFTPNGDNLNDEFIISGYNVAEITDLVIFNRIGQEVFHEQNIEIKNGKMQNGWDGNDINNIRCNSGVYVYSYKIKCLNGADLEYSGNITLVR